MPAGGAGVEVLAGRAGRAGPVVVTPARRTVDRQQAHEVARRARRARRAAHDGEPRRAHLGGDRDARHSAGAASSRALARRWSSRPPCPPRTWMRAGAHARGRRRGPARGRWRPWPPGGARSMAPAARRPSPGPPASTESKSPTARSTAQAQGLRVVDAGVGRDHAGAPPASLGRWARVDGVAAGDHHHRVARAWRCHEPIPSAGITRFRFLGRWRAVAGGPPSQPGYPELPFVRRAG